MFYLLAVATGAVLAVMIAINGGLSGAFGVYLATVIIHITGILAILLVCALRRESLRIPKRLPVIYFMGGVFGVFVTVFNNVAFAAISVSALLSLGLLGQAAASLVMDHTRLFGGAGLPFNKRKLAGYTACLAGTILMLLDNTGAAGGGTPSAATVAIGILLAFLTGIVLVANRTCNARLAGETSPTISCAYNYITGLSASLLALAVVFFAGGIPTVTTLPHPITFTGGLIGVCTVLVLNITVGRIPAMYVSLLTFVGQVFTGLILDWFLSGLFSPVLLAGGVLVSLGLCFNFMLDRAQNA